LSVIAGVGESKEGIVKLRIALWATLGALVVVAWRIYISATLSNPLGTDGVGRILAWLTCPISIAGRHPQGFYFVLVVNAATYALIGLVVEAIRAHHPTHLSSD
jgi:hypothetical protein